MAVRRLRNPYYRLNVAQLCRENKSLGGIELAGKGLLAGMSGVNTVAAFTTTRRFTPSRAGKNSMLPTCVRLRGNFHFIARFAPYTPTRNSNTAVRRMKHKEFFVSGRNSRPAYLFRISIVHMSLSSRATVK